MARTVVITAQTVINAAHNTKTAPYTHRSGEIYHQALPLSLFIGQASVCACTASYLHYPSHIPYCNLLYALICFRIRTILLAFRRVSVCVSLYGFVFALSLPLFVGEELAPPVAHNTAITTTVAKSQPPLAPHHVLASLVKGEVLSPEKIRATTGGIAPHPHQSSQNRTIPCPAPCPCLPSKKGEVLLLSQAEPTVVGIAPSPPSIRFSALSLSLNLPPLSKVRCCRPKKFGRLPEGLLPIRTNPPKTSPSFKNRHHHCLLMNVPFVLHPHYPTPRTTTLASLVKGRWIDGKAQVLILLLSACDMSTIFML